MIEIKDLLQGFSNKIFAEERKKDLIRKAISEAVKTEIKPGDMKLRDGVVYLNLKPIYKNEILLKYDQIRADLKSTLGEKAPREVR